MPKPEATEGEKCEQHGKVRYRSVEHAIGGALFLAKKKGTARIYWEHECGNYHITSQASPLRARSKPHEN